MSFKYKLLKDFYSESLARQYPVLADVILARDISNVEQVEKFLEDFHVDDNPKINDWLDTTLRKYIINKYEKVKSYRPKPSDPDWMRGKEDLKEVIIDDAIAQKVQHIVDFLREKLHIQQNYNIKSLQAEEAFKQSEEWTKSLTKKKLKKEGEGTDYIIIKEFDNGWFWADLISKNATETEGNKMGHCVGGMSYWTAVQSGKTKIFSLRDPSNDPHCTIEYDIANQAIRQIKGKQNRAVISKYMPYVVAFLSDSSVPIKSISAYELSLNGLIKSKTGFLSLRDLPEGAEIDGDLDLVKFKDDEIINLPNNLKVFGDLILPPGAVIKPNTEVSKDIKYIGGKNELPSGLKARSLEIFKSSITKLPDDIKIEKNINAEFSQLSSIPALKIAGDFVLSDTPIETLPDGLDIGGELDLMNTSISVIPENTRVGVAIFVDDENSMQIPEHLKKIVY